MRTPYYYYYVFYLVWGATMFFYTLRGSNVRSQIFYSPIFSTPPNAVNAVTWGYVTAGRTKILL